MKINELVIVGLGLGFLYFITKQKQTAQVKAQAEEIIPEPTEEGTFKQAVETAEGTIAAETPYSAIYPYISDILPAGEVKLGYVGGLCGVWYNPSSTLDMAYVNQLSKFQNQAIRNIMDLDNPLIQHAIAVEIAQRTGYTTTAW